MKKLLTTCHHEGTYLMSTMEHVAYHFLFPFLVGLMLLYSFGNLALILSKQNPVGIPLTKISSPSMALLKPKPFLKKIIPLVPLNIPWADFLLAQLPE